jgi:hypothetical protein
VIAGAHGGTTPAGQVEQTLLQVAPGRFDAYENLLASLADGQVWMLLWQGAPGSPDARYGAMEVAGHRYAPCFSSPRELAASGWNRDHEVVSGREIAQCLYPERLGLWINPHAAGGGVGVPWADLRRVAVGLDVLPAGPLQIGEPSLPCPSSTPCSPRPPTAPPWCGRCARRGCSPPSASRTSRSAWSSTTGPRRPRRRCG